MKVCDRQSVTKFLKKELEEDHILAFLYHLDECSSCWEEVYNAEKAKHPEYYKKPSKRSRALEKELQRRERSGNEQDEISEVA